MSSGPDDVDDLLDLLRARGVRLTTDGTALHYDAPADALTDEVIDELRRLKPDLLKRLADVPGDGDPDGPEVVRTAPASMGQARQYLQTVASEVPSVFTIGQRFSLRGSLDPTALQEALTSLVVRHPALRTRYAVRHGEVLQQVLAPAPVALPVLAVTEERLDRVVAEWTGQPFALDVEPGFRALLLRPNAIGHWELVLAMHHGISDGLSMAVLVRDLGELYRAAVSGQTPDLPVLTADFVDFSHWEREYLARDETRRTVRAWADEVGVDLVPIWLPTDCPRGTVRSQAGAVATATLSRELHAEVRTFAAGRNATPYSVLAAAFALLLHRLTGAPSIPLTAAVANRIDARFEQVVGVFGHASWLVIPVRGARSFHELVDRASTATWRLLSAQSIPTALQNEALGGAFSADPPRVYLAMLDVADPILRLPGIEPAVACDIPLPGSRADQAWGLRPANDGTLTLTVEYATALFAPATISAWIDRYVDLLRTLLTQPDAALPAIDA